jgi:endoglucanase
MITDPKNNTGTVHSIPHTKPLSTDPPYPAFDIHEYLDADFSGTSSVCSQAAATNLAPLTSWLQEYGFKAMISEFGGANGTECDSYITGIIDYMAQNDVYIGWSAWAAGPLWGSNSACCANSEEWGSLEPGTTASDGSPGMYTTVWLEEIEPLLPNTLQQSGMSGLNGGNGSGGSSSSSVSTSASKTTTSTTSTTTTTTSTTSTTTTAAPTGVPLYGQCGGDNYTGSTICAAGTCTYQNPYYSQCL